MWDKTDKFCLIWRGKKIHVSHFSHSLKWYREYSEIIWTAMIKSAVKALENTFDEGYPTAFKNFDVNECILRWCLKFYRICSKLIPHLITQDSLNFRP